MVKKIFGRLYKAKFEIPGIRILSWSASMKENITPNSDNSIVSNIFPTIIMDFVTRIRRAHSNSSYQPTQRQNSPKIQTIKHSLLVNFSNFPATLLPQALVGISQCLKCS